MKKKYYIKNSLILIGLVSMRRGDDRELEEMRNLGREFTEGSARVESEELTLSTDESAFSEIRTKIEQKNKMILDLYDALKVSNQKHIELYEEVYIHTHFYFLTHFCAMTPFFDIFVVFLMYFCVMTILTTFFLFITAFLSHFCVMTRLCDIFVASDAFFSAFLWCYIFRVTFLLLHFCVLKCVCFSFNRIKQ